MKTPFRDHEAVSYTAVNASMSEQYRFLFPNGYGASVIRGPYSYGGDRGLWELAVTINQGLTYDTPITDDVEGSLTADRVADLLDQIAALPAVAA